jgi:hypothetical protein
LECFFEQEIEQNLCLAHSFSWQTDSLPLGCRFLQGRNSSPQCSHVFTAEQDLTDLQGAGFCPASVREESVIGCAGDTTSIGDLNVYKFGHLSRADRQDTRRPDCGFHNMPWTYSFDGGHAARSEHGRAARKALVHDHQVESIQFTGTPIDRLDARRENCVFGIAASEPRRIEANWKIGAQPPDLIGVLFQ